MNEDPPTSETSPADAPPDVVPGATPTTDPSGRPAIPPAAYTARAQIARDKGLPGLYIEGGEDPELRATLERERPYTRLLVGMVVAIVIGGFVLGIIGLYVGELFGI